MPNLNIIHADKENLDSFPDVEYLREEIMCVTRLKEEDQKK